MPRTPMLIALVVIAAGSAGCTHDGADREHQTQQPRPHPVDQRPRDIAGDTRPVVKQGGDVPPQPARLDRSDPPLLEAARSGDARRVRTLLDAGADVNAFGNGRTTALMAAAEAGRDDVVRLLLERRADANLRNAKGQTAAEVADAAEHARLRAVLQQTEVKPPPGPANPTPPR